MESECRRAFRGYPGIILILLLLAVVGEFMVRGPLRAVARLPAFNDFAEPYAGSRAWIFGLDPYDPITARYLWQRAGGDAQAGELLAMYPPSSFLVLAPFAALSWPAAMQAWTYTTVALFLLACRGLLQLAGLPWPGRRSAAFLVLAVGLAPIQTGIANGNISVAATMLSILGVWAASRGHNLGAAVFLAAGCALKPQLGIWFLVYYLVRRRWAVAVPALTLVSVCALLAVARLWPAWPMWMQSYMSNYHHWFAVGSIHDFSTENPSWFQLLNLQGLFYVLYKSRVTANVAAWLAFAAGFGVWLYSNRRNRDQHSELLSLSGVVIIALFPVYHRFYDAGLLLLPICWSLRSVQSRLQPVRATALLTLPFLVPGPAIAFRMAKQSGLGTITETGFWKAIVLGHQTWALLLLGCVLLYANMMSLRQPALEAPCERRFW